MEGESGGTPAVSGENINDRTYVQRAQSRQREAVCRRAKDDRRAARRIGTQDWTA